MAGKKSEHVVKANRYRTAAVIVLLGSIWGMFECILGGIGLYIGAFRVSMGAVLAGTFAIGVMGYGRKLTGMKWGAMGIAAVAGLLRFAAPVGSCVLCSAIAIMAEGVVFELIMNRPVFRLYPHLLRKSNTLVYLGVLMGYTIFVTGYIITQILTPIVGGGTLDVGNVVRILPLILGRGFFAALFGGIIFPIVVLVPHLNMEIFDVKKEIYYPLTVGISALCWIVSIAVSYPGIL